MRCAPLQAGGACGGAPPRCAQRPHRRCGSTVNDRAGGAPPTGTYAQGRALPSPASGTQGRTNAVDRCAGNVWHPDALRSCTGSFRHKRSILFSFSCARRAGVPFSCKKKEPKRTCVVPDRYKQKAAATFVATAIPHSALFSCARRAGVSFSWQERNQKELVSGSSLTAAA